EAMREAIEAHKLRDHIAIEERHSPDSLFVKGRPETVIIDAASIQTVPMHGDTLAMFKGWFDNEWGYVANTLRLATKAHQLMREM
ncbi:hypothetical protein KC959_01665, partial [Candidatus Saccharibacteria bacterium]|nr:hypothetical protein [Candidatus Saccharibacteria bacterium]